MSLRHILSKYGKRNLHKDAVGMSISNVDSWVNYFTKESGRCVTNMNIPSHGIIPISSLDYLQTSKHDSVAGKKNKPITKWLVLTDPGDNSMSPCVDKKPPEKDKFIMSVTPHYKLREELTVGDSCDIHWKPA